ncbi:MAG: hypothetical protein A2Y40_07855 [Candidatus Margulisbacteria bacterium GWF2_35_9]|nr:MAG: hypothetical protein A2Y40_07855 [Candidatus Margulisbacteria bacterium GWF2_35_9]
MEKTNQKLYQKLTYKVGDLLPLPTTVSELIKLANNPNVTSRDIGKIIERDQAMASKILRLANSASYGFSQRIRTISHAIVCLGFNKVKSLALTVSTLKMLSDSLAKYNLDAGALYKHSLAVAVAANIIAEKTKAKDPEEVYLMGLLHDIGKLIINTHTTNELEDVWTYYKTHKDIKFFQAEKAVFGFDHADIGGEAARGWNLPNELCNAIGYHHTPHSAPGDNRCAFIIHLADGIAKTIDIGKGLSSDQSIAVELEGTFKERNLEVINLKNEDIMGIREQVSIKLHEVIDELDNNEDS